MAYSSNKPNEKRGFQPPQNDQERLLVRRVEDLCSIAQKRGIARYSNFLSDREQILAQAALNRSGCEEYSFEGGYPNAERKLLCIEPAGAYGEPPICCIKVQCVLPSSSAQPPAHKDYMGAILGLGLQRDCMGDVVLNPDEPGTAFVFLLNTVSQLLCDELTSIGRYTARAEYFFDEIPCGTTERELKTATVSSLRVDAVLAAMLHCSRSQASDFLRAGLVEINHVAVNQAHAAVYEGDLFTVRGKGRFRLEELGGKSRKDRLFITFFQY